VQDVNIAIALPSDCDVNNFLWLHMTVALFSPRHVSRAGMRVMPHSHVTLKDAEIV